MDIQITNYIFDKTAKTIIFSDFETINRQRIRFISHCPTGLLLFSNPRPAGSILGGTVNGNTLTLDADTSSMSDSDDLQIIYNDENIVSSSKQDDQLTLLISLLMQKGIDDPVWYDMATNALRITGAVSATISSGTVTAVTTVGTVTNQSLMGGQPADLISENLTEVDWALTTRNLLTT